MPNAYSTINPIIPTFPVLEVLASVEGTYVGNAFKEYYFRMGSRYIDEYNALKSRLLVETDGRTYRVAYVRRKKLIWSSDILFLDPKYEIETIADGDPFAIAFEELQAMCIDYSSGSEYTHSEARARLLRKKLKEAVSISDIFEIFEKE